jgi:actin-related protein
MKSLNLFLMINLFIFLFTFIISIKRPKSFLPLNTQEGLISSWLGGSIVASMGSFDSLLMSKRDYEEHGSILIERKLF